MQYTMGTTAIESLNAAANIFIGMVRVTEISGDAINANTW